MSSEQSPPRLFPPTGPGETTFGADTTVFAASRKPQLIAATLTRWFDIDEKRAGATLKPMTKSRRRLAAGLDHVKHRRTRSGCYTCRSRRVKCDEAHPICERCKKGSRQCIYPEASDSSRGGPAAKLGQLRRTVESDSSDYEDIEEEALAEVLEEDVNEVYQAWNRGPHTSSKKVQKASWQASKTSRIDSMSRAKLKIRSPSTDASTLPKSRSPSASTNTPGKQSIASTDTSVNSSWSHLPFPVQRHLEYHRQHICHHHYMFKHDSTQFIRSTLLDIALEYDPLLYAVVGFSSYHSTLQRSNGKVEDFLAYYNSSVQLLRKSLASESKHTDATILTILQLAVFEEFLGDWVNLLGHQKAACEMIFELYTPETIMGTESSRNIIHWYMRFDLFAGLMSGSDLKLGREWFVAYDDYWRAMVKSEPENLDYLLDSLISDNILLGTDMALLFAKLPRGAISMTDFATENAQLQARIQAFGNRMQPLIQRQDCLIMPFAGTPPLGVADVVNPFQPGGLYSEPLWALNYVLMDRCAIDAMHRLQTSMVTRQDLSAELIPLAMEQCRIFEAIEMWPGQLTGSLLPAQATCGLVALLLPREGKYTMWCRRKLAKIESMGYIYPMALRSKLSSLWSLPSVLHWWLPEDEAPGYPPLMRAIRAFIEDRAAAPRSQAGKDVRNMKAMFSSLAIGDSTDGRQWKTG